MNDNYGWKQLKGEPDQSEDADKACMHCSTAQAVIHYFGSKQINTLSTAKNGWFTTDDH